MGQALSFEVYSGSHHTEQARRAAEQTQQRHRCDARVEDMCRALAASWGQMRETVPAAWGNLVACYSSEPGWAPAGEGGAARAGGGGRTGSAPRTSSRTRPAAARLAPVVRALSP